MRDNALYQQKPDNGPFDNRYVTKLLRNYRYVFDTPILLVQKLSWNLPQIPRCYPENSQRAVL